ncbi:MAG: 4Fe-4S binding protein [Spirochaetes bacterium]|nr:4Fe-4S binding protein [Spirochaetota bacterium]
MIKYLATHDEKCVGCLACVSVCSKLYFKEENPSKSRIVVEDGLKGTFHLVACDQECEACLRECPTRAITRSKAGIIVIDPKKCVGCLACVASCPIGAMRWYPGAAVPFKCLSCGACARTCPKEALEVVSKETCV